LRSDRGRIDLAGNRGNEIVEVGEREDVPEEVAIRGYTMRKHKVMEIIINEPGGYVIGPD
jgi:hypothetical protein